MRFSVLDLRLKANSQEDAVESLLEEIIDLQSNSPEFRLLFKSQQTTEILISGYSSFVSSGMSSHENKHKYVRILEKLSHFVLALAMDKIVNNSQKQEVNISSTGV